MKYKIRKRILQIPAARTSRSWLKKIKFKKYDNLSLYRFLKIFLHNIHEDEIMNRANGVAYNFVLAIFPLVIFLFTLIPYITTYFPDVNQHSIMEFLGDLMPTSMYEVISSTVLDIVSNQRGGLLTFGFLFAFYLAANGMLSLMRAFNACYQTVERRSIWRMRITASGLTLMLAVVLVLAILLLVVGQFLLNYAAENIAEVSKLGLDKYTLSLLVVLRFLVIFTVFFIAISFIYFFGPAVHYKWSFFSIGSFLATLACLGISFGFSYYITNFATYNKVYGSIGALIALMVWIQLLTTVLLFGFEINASLHYGRKAEAIDFHKRNKRRERAQR